jgi:hypothetical protein
MDSAVFQLEQVGSHAIGVITRQRQLGWRCAGRSTGATTTR